MSNLGIFLTVFFDHCATYLHSENTVRSITKLDQIEHFGLSKKAAVISNFCLIGKIHHNFLVLRMIELACKTFMPFLGQKWLKLKPWQNKKGQTFVGMLFFCCFLLQVADSNSKIDMQRTSISKNVWPFLFC